MEKMWLRGSLAQLQPVDWAACHVPPRRPGSQAFSSISVLRLSQLVRAKLNPWAPAVASGFVMERLHWPDWQDWLPPPSILLCQYFACTAQTGISPSP